MRRQIVVSVDLGGTNIRLALVDSAGTILKRRRLPMFAAQSGESLCAALADVVAAFVGTRGDRRTPAGLAVGFAGLTSSRKGYVYFAPNVGRLTGLEVRKCLAARLAMPVLVENDANCAAVGEYWRGAGMGTDSLFMFTLGTGIGGGFVIDGRLWDGHDGIAGEIGHTVVAMDGPECRCGNRGCLEGLASGTAIVRAYREATGKKPCAAQDAITARMVADRAKRGEAAARRVIGIAARALGVGIANVFNLLNPEMIVMGGGVSRAGPVVIAPAISVAREHISSPLRTHLNVKRAKLGDDAGVIGAAYLALAEWRESRERGPGDRD